MKKHFFISAMFGLILTLMLQGCEKKKDPVPETRLDYRPVMETSLYNDEIWNKMMYTYESERLTIIEDYYYEFGTPVPDEKLMYSYPSGSTVELDVYDMSTNPPESDNRRVYTLDGDRITEIVFSFEYTDLFDVTEWYTSGKDVFTYSGEQLTKEESFDYDDDTWVLSSRTTYHYEGGKIKEIKGYYSDDQGGMYLQWEDKIEYEEDRISQIISYYGGELANKSVPEYNENRIVSDIVYSMSSGSWTPYYLSEYEYDEVGNCTSEKETYYETGEEYTTNTTYEKGKSNFYLLRHWPGREMTDFSVQKSDGHDWERIHLKKLNRYLFN